MCSWWMLSRERAVDRALMFAYDATAGDVRTPAASQGTLT